MLTNLIKIIEHLLDDFITVEPSDSPPIALQVIKFVFQKLGIPLAEDKVFGPTTCLDFLGITLGTLLMKARLPQDKVEKLRALIASFTTRKKCTKRELLSLIGSFNFACKVIVPGHTFLSRMIRLSCTVKELHYHVHVHHVHHVLKLLGRTLLCGVYFFVHGMVAVSF